MLGSLFLTAALGWLACWENPRIDDPSVVDLYSVGCDAACDEPAADCCAGDGEMCSAEPLTCATKPARAVAVEFRLIHAPANLGEKIVQTQFLSSSQTRDVLSLLQNDPRIEVIAAPKMVLCSGQLGIIKLGDCPQSATGACCDQPKPAPVAPGQNFRASIGYGLRIGVPALGPVPVALDVGMPVAAPANAAAKPAKTCCTNNFELKATPVVSADGRYVQLDLERTTPCCAGGQYGSKNQTCTTRAHVVCADGSTVVLQGMNGPQIPVLSDVPFFGELFQAHGATPNHVVMMATVKVLNDEDGPGPASCTRSSPQVVEPPACCEKCDTVESNLAKLQAAKELLDLAFLYERIDQGDVAQKVHAGIVDVCPGSRIACQAEERCRMLAAKARIDALCAAAAAHGSKAATPAIQVVHAAPVAYVIEPPDVLTVELVRGLPERLRGERVVRTDGSVDLGSYGSVCVAGLTIDQARQRIEQHLATYLRNPRVRVDVYAYNSKGYFVVANGNGAGEQVVRLPYTGNETVLDAIAQVGGLSSTTGRTKVWLARPGTGVLPIDWMAIVQAGDATTNYQMRPNDRLCICADVASRNIEVAGEEEADVPAKSTLDSILASYRKACKAGNADRARQLAIEALAIDPTCFGK
jgi:protein involved in polysaccharide export with SLBB domain